MEKVIIIMPAWNEEDNIRRMIDELVDNEFPKIKQAEMHLLVVDNYSKDKTAKIVEEASKTRKNVHVIQQGEKSGLGWAYITGMKYAIKKLNADAVIEMDADFQHPPRFVGPMVQAYLDGAGYVIGSRYIPGGSVPKEWPLFRKAISFFGNLFIRIVLTKPKLHDLTTGFRLTKVKGVLDKIALDKLMEPHRFAYKVDLLYQSVKNTKKVVEVPLQFASRKQEKSKFNTKEMISTFKVAIILGIKDKQRFIKFGTVGFLGFLVNFLFLRVFRGLGLVEILTWLFSTELAIINNYVLNNIWTFREAKIGGIGKTISKFLQFNLTSAGALVIQSFFGPLGVKFVGVEYDWLVLIFVVVFLVLPYNYFMYNAVIWKTWKLPWSKKKRT
ncbi:glycosyltransferase family 2 protein [Patescibacteria group bacterium]|nr:glycosyltransferase family 2 protein [Patescibacteria group bacterium]MBU0922499.1 glycosyltransferase family 2 protein [Patescibacteria group bacterium]MBU1066323.1 glycosyltransferase family 2 protein [Patescibacteria group bacterium]MBU1845139.1 glycosyltransferase family 2 protein [Patescibacteria group bacterium]